MATTEEKLLTYLNNSKEGDDLPVLLSPNGVEYIIVYNPNTDRLERVLLGNKRELKKETFIYTPPNNIFIVPETISELFDIQIGNGANFNDYATINNGNEVTIDSSLLSDGISIKIIYTI